MDSVFAAIHLPAHDKLKDPSRERLPCLGCLFLPGHKLTVLKQLVYINMAVEFQDAPYGL